MTPARFAAVVRGLNGTARQVLDAVPAAEPVSVQRVVEQLHRQGRPKERGVVLGCLARMVDVGVLVEPERRQYRRAA